MHSTQAISIAMLAFVATVYASFILLQRLRDTDSESRVMPLA